MLVLPLMTLAVLLTGAAAVWLVAKLACSFAPTEEFDTWTYLEVVTRMCLSSILLIAMLLWLASRCASFVPAFALGIGGTFFALVGTSARTRPVLPWQIPVNMLASDPTCADVALLVSFAGGKVALVGMLTRLSRREVS